MKKILSTAFAFLMAVSLGACSSEPQKEEETASVQESEQIPETGNEEVKQGQSPRLSSNGL